MTVAAPQVLPLRDYQRPVLPAVHEALGRGVKRQLISLATGGGKTVIAAHIVRDFGWRTLFVVHRDELAKQAMGTLGLINPEKSIGLVKADSNELAADIIVASAQTLAQPRRLETLAAAVEGAPLLHIEDECFVAGTLIGSTRIEDIVAGSMVDAFNEATGAMERRRVVATMRRPAPDTLYRLTVGGVTTVVTGNHPVYTPRGWRRASTLRPGDEAATHGLHRVRSADAGGGARPPKDVEFVRVDGVAVLERGSDGEHERVCPDGYVYNFEVEGLHTYVANGLVVHNCHHSPARTRKETIDRLDADLLIGLTATPGRGDKAGLDSVFDEIVFHIGMLDLMRQGRLAPLKGIRIETDIDLDAVRVRAGEFVESDLADTVNTAQRNALIVSEWAKHAAGRKRTVAFCVDVAHAVAVRDAFRDAGVTSEAILGSTPSAERSRILSDFHAGRISVLTNCMVLTEGYDEPAIDCIVMARPTKSRGLYIQCLDMDTEVLTRRGFLTDERLSDDDEVAGVDPVTGKVRWLPIRSRVRREAQPGERMVSIQSPSLDIRVTDGHRMLIQRRTGRGASRRWLTPEFRTAGEIAGSSWDVRLPVSAHEDVPDCELSDDEIRFLGWWLTDGTVNRVNKAITISQATHQPHFDEIEKVLTGCGFRYGVQEFIHPLRPTTTMAHFIVSRGDARRVEDRPLRGWHRLEKWIDKGLSPEYERLSERQFGVLMEALHLGDGSKQTGQDWTQRSYHISTGRLDFAERLQALGVRRGWRMHIALREPSGWSKRPSYVIHAKKIDRAHIQCRPADGRPSFEQEAPRAGEMVWCVENDLGTLITRRNGKVAVVGNCAGRGARTSPEKEDCLVLDMADNTTRHSLVTFPSLIGEAAEVGTGGRMAPGEPVDLRELDDLIGQVRVRRAVEVDLFGSSPVLWRPVGTKGMFYAPAGAGRDENRWVAVVESGKGYLPMLITVPKDRYASPTARPLFDRALDAEMAMGIAEDAVERNPLTSRKASWRRRKEEPSEAQLRFAASIGAKPPAGATKAEVSAMIDERLFIRAARRVGLEA